MANEINTNQVRSMERLVADFLERAHNYIGQAESSGSSSSGTTIWSMPTTCSSRSSGF